MAAPESLKDAYIEELRDLWSANDQMQRVVKRLSAQAHEAKLKQMLEQSVSGIAQHTAALRSLLEASGGKVEKDHCRGMEGLVNEAVKHAIDERIENSELRDLAIIAQYQRMSHYGLAGFGTAAAYAKALGQTADETKLKSIVRDIYKADEYGSHVAATAMKVAGKH